ncbi:MAG TPA: hypothetical protein VFE31_02580 [Opitutaceae bacterium]|jgi:hypothetical protein|nr:hypothetical protein [Opitutaceae bacterium]
MAFPHFRWDALERLRDSLTEAQWDGLRVAGITAAVGIVAAAGYWAGRPAWRHWQNRSALAQARNFAAQQDYRSMLLALRRATETAPDDRATWEAVVRDLGLIGSPDELMAQEQVIRLAPGEAGPRLALAQEALRFGRYDTAQTALDGLDSSQRADAAYYRLAAALAMDENRPGEMKRDLAALVALTPGDADAQFTYAALRLWSAEPAERAAGLAEMHRLTREPQVRVRAALELIGFVAKQRDPAGMDRLLRELIQTFDPADASRVEGSDVRAWNLLLAALMRAGSDAPSDAALLARWLADLGQRPQALAWLERLPPDVRRAPAAADMEAQLAAEGDDYPVLERELAANAWGAWPESVWRAAIAAHRAGAAAGAASWRRALDACGDSLGAYRNLARLAIIWHAPRAAEEAWSAALDRDPDAHWAFDALRQSYRERQDYTDLLNAYARQADRQPANETVAANWILLACLLDQTSEAVNMRAESLSSATPLNLIAKAADLWRLERPDQAQEKLSRLSADERRDPQGAFWSAVIGADGGNPAEARAALALAQRTPRDPLEARLLDDAAAKLRAAR